MINLTKNEILLENIEAFLTKDRDKHRTIGRVVYQQDQKGYICETVNQNKTFLLKIIMYPEQEHIIMEIIPIISMSKELLVHCMKSICFLSEQEKPRIMVYPSYDTQRISLQCGIDYSTEVPESIDFEITETRLINKAIEQIYNFQPGSLPNSV